MPEPTRTDLRDVTFTIPVRIDHEDRAENLRVVVHFLLSNFETNLVVCEQDTREVGRILDRYDYRYLTTTRPDGLIHRTRQLNLMCREADTPFVVNCDADVLVQPDRYVKAVRLLRKGKASWVLPHSGRTYDIDRAHRPEILRSASLESVGRITRSGTLLHDRSVGGILFFDKQAFVEGGMENERFVAWGYEDNERHYRFRALGYRLARLRGHLYHLAHHRSSQSDDSHPYFKANEREFLRVKAMNRRQLRAEVSTWSWCR